MNRKSLKSKSKNHLIGLIYAKTAESKKWLKLYNQASSEYNAVLEKYTDYRKKLNDKKRKIQLLEEDIDDLKAEKRNLLSNSINYKAGFYIMSIAALIFLAIIIF